MEVKKSLFLQLDVTMTTVWFYLCLILLAVTECLANQEFVQQPENTTIIEGLTVVLRCSVKNRAGSLQWTQKGMGLGIEKDLPGYERYSMVGGVRTEGSDLIEEFNLKIINVHLNDDGDYQCQVGPTSDVQRISSVKVYLNVQVPPERPSMGNKTPMIEVIEGVNTNISCQAKNGKPAAEITWFMSGTRVTHNVISRAETKTNKLVDTISVMQINASRADTGKKIECSVKNPALDLPYVTYAHLDVQYPPVLTILNNISRTIREYDHVQFKCNCMANPAAVTWRWYHNNVEIEGATSDTLDIPRISRDYHESEISCEGTNKVGSRRANTVLIIEFGPRFVGPPQHASVDLGDRVILSCTAQGNPKPSIIWTRKGSIVPLETRSTYTIRSVTGNDLGTYECTATSMDAGFPSVSRDIYIFRKGPPQILSPKLQYAATGEKAEVECKIRSIPEPTAIVWERNNEVIVYKDTGHYSESQKRLVDGIVHYLNINSVKESDFGDYNCSVRNVRGSAMQTITLKEKEILPLSYIIGGVVGGVASIFIIILIFFLCRKCKASDADSYAETDSNTEIKKRDKSDSPSDFKSTLMEQWRQDLNYHCQADYEDLYGPKITDTDPKLNSSGYGTLASENYINAYDNHPAPNGGIHQNGGPLYSNYTHTQGEEILPSESVAIYRPPSRWTTHSIRSLQSPVPYIENGTYGTSSFRSVSRTDYTNPDYIDSYRHTPLNDINRLPPADVNTAKLATTV